MHSFMTSGNIKDQVAELDTAVHIKENALLALYQ